MLTTDHQSLPDSTDANPQLHLGWLERAIVQALANLGPATSSQLHRALLAEQGQDISYNMVDHKLRGLQRKGVISREQRDGQYISILKEGIEIPPVPLTPGLADWEEEDAAEAHAGGYQQIPDTSWWEGTPGAALTIGERRYQPLDADASLTLAAVYRWDRHPCYWLAVTHGSITQQGAGRVRIVEELLIPAEQGELLGAAGAVVGRLMAPTTAAHRLKPRLKHAAASQAQLDEAYLGNLLAGYQQHEGLSEEQLAQQLGCSSHALDDIFLCLRPDQREEDGAAFNRYVRLVASVAGAPAHLLGAALRGALRVERGEEPVTTSEDGTSEVAPI